MTFNCHKLTSEFTKKIKVSTNDPNHPQEVLTCKGKILEPVVLKPKRINFGQISRKVAPPQKIIQLTRGDGGPINLKLGPINTPGVAAQIKEIEAGESYELAISLNPPFKSSRVRETLKLETGIAESPTITIPIYAAFRPRVVAQPRRFMVPSVRKSNWQQSVRLVWEDDLPHKILEATVDEPSLKVQLDNNNDKQQVVLLVPVDYKPRPGAHNVIIKTDDAEAPTVRVPITVTRRARPPRSKRPTPPLSGSQKSKTKKTEAGTTKAEAKKPEKTNTEKTTPSVPTSE